VNQARYRSTELVKLRVNSSGKRRSILVVEVEEYGTGTGLMHKYVQEIID
jgi:hypothetical protein